jgi:nucleotide-binding universal stress UspA family protein
MKKILIGMDFSTSALNALEQAIHLTKIYDFEPVIVYSQENFFDWFDTVQSGPERMSEETLEKMNTVLDAYPTDIRERIEVEYWEGRPAQAMLKSAKQNQVELIVMGMKGRSAIEEIFVGSTCQRVVELSERPVFAVHDHLKTLPKKMVYCCDFLSSNTAAFNWAKKLSKIDHISTDLLHIVTPSSVVEAKDVDIHSIQSLEDALNRALEQAKLDANQLAGAFLSNTREFIQKTPIVAPGVEIMKHIKEHKNDLVVLGSHGHRQVKRWLLGSTADYLLRRSEISLFIAK